MRRNLSETLSSELDMATTLATAIMNSWNQDYLHKTWHKIKPASSIAANELQTFSHTDELSALDSCWGERIRPTDRFPELQ